MSLVIVNIKKGGTDDDPNDWRIRAALARAINWIGRTMLVECIRHPHGRLQFVLGFLERRGMDNSNVSVESFLSSDEAGQGRNDPIIATSRVIVKVDQALSGQGANFGLDQDCASKPALPPYWPSLIVPRASDERSICFQ